MCGLGVQDFSNQTVCFRLLRHPSRPNAPRPVSLLLTKGSLTLLPLVEPHHFSEMKEAAICGGFNHCLPVCEGLKGKAMRDEPHATDVALTLHEFVE